MSIFASPGNWRAYLAHMPHLRQIFIHGYYGSIDPHEERSIIANLQAASPLGRQLQVNISTSLRCPDILMAGSLLGNARYNPNFPQDEEQAWELIEMCRPGIRNSFAYRKSVDLFSAGDEEGGDLWTWNIFP